MNYNEKVFFCIVICTFLLLFAYILYLCFKQIKRYKDIIFELNNNFTTSLTSEDLFFINRDDNSIIFNVYFYVDILGTILSCA